jgi:hypothetical protein
MASVIVRTPEELRAERAELLRQAGTTYDDLRDRGESYQLTTTERNIWETIRTIDYLLGDE